MPIATDLAPILSEMGSAGLDHASDEDVVEAIRAMVAHPDYPCLGARSVFRRDSAHLHVLDSMGPDESATDELAEKLGAFAAEHGADEEFVSFLTVFRGPVPASESEFERAMWAVLQGLHDRDDRPWPATVEADPTSPHFAFSFAGTAFFVVGLHPAASRIARRAPLPTLVFNLHHQFERLRSETGFDRMRTAIRRRDARLQGTVNPMVDDYGSSSAARQYSGRAVGPDWKAPFTP
ncbi:MAG: guanitoxin biosynthesis heme-dependent pre-guanitoxin N-hydroxylase GntA [Dermatophilaceae bacterium]